MRGVRLMGQFRRRKGYRPILDIPAVKHKNHSEKNFVGASGNLGSPMRSVGHVGPILLLLLGSLLPLGCGGSVTTDIPPSTLAAAAHYPVRSDLMAKGDLGAPTRWSSAGCSPLRGLRLGNRSPDPELGNQLRPKLGKEILDPVAGLTAGQRDVIGRLLETYFGTPAAPTVRLLTLADAAKLKLEEMFDPVPGKEPKDIVADLVREATIAHAAIKLDETSLARGSTLYRRGVRPVTARRAKEKWLTPLRALPCRAITGGGCSNS